MRPGTLVLLYHRVAVLDRDPYGLAVRPDRFAEQCDILRRRYDVVPLTATNGHSPQVAITFDDGYVDNTHACSILEAAGLPATFFITTGRIGQRQEVWWDRLEQIVLGCDLAVDRLEIEIAGIRLWADIRSSMARARAHLALHWRLKRLSPTVIESILSEIEVQLGVHAVDRDTHRWMSIGELRALSEKPRIDVGAHTLTHPMLATLPASEQRKEIDGSRRELERLLEKRVSVFSYPYGGHDAFDATATHLVRESGYAFACTGTGGLAGPEQYPFLVPRNVVGDWDGARFERWLDHWRVQS